MRTAILLLVWLMFTLLGNIIAYSVSEDYRFFVKKIKYPWEVVYENTQQVDDSERVILVENDSETTTTIDSNIVIVGQEGFTFLDAIWRKEDIWDEDESLPELTFRENEIIEKFKDKFVLSNDISTTSLFDITTEYPDEYHEYFNKHMSLYIFSTKTYEQVYSIFDVLTYELPYSINETNNFWEKSFYINLEWWYSDDKVRIVFEYENKVFWLKITKDSYNTVKQILDELDVQ
jgi:hypothetical protein